MITEWSSTMSKTNTYCKLCIYIFITKCAKHSNKIVTDKWLKQYLGTSMRDNILRHPWIADAWLGTAKKECGGNKHVWRCSTFQTLDSCLTPQHKNKQLNIAHSYSLLTRKLLNQWFRDLKLKSTLRKFLTVMEYLFYI